MIKYVYSFSEKISANDSELSSVQMKKLDDLHASCVNKELPGHFMALKVDNDHVTQVVLFIEEGQLNQVIYDRSWPQQSPRVTLKSPKAQSVQMLSVATYDPLSAGFSPEVGQVVIFDYRQLQPYTTEKKIEWFERAKGHTTRAPTTLALCDVFNAFNELKCLTAENWLFIRSNMNVCKPIMVLKHAGMLDETTLTWIKAHENSPYVYSAMVTLANPRVFSKGIFEHFMSLDEVKLNRLSQLMNQFSSLNILSSALIETLLHHGHLELLEQIVSRLQHIDCLNVQTSHYILSKKYAYLDAIQFVLVSIERDISGQSPVTRQDALNISKQLVEMIASSTLQEFEMIYEMVKLFKLNNLLSVANLSLLTKIKYQPALLAGAVALNAHHLLDDKTWAVLSTSRNLVQLATEIEWMSHHHLLTPLVGNYLSFSKIETVSLSAILAKTLIENDIPCSPLLFERFLQQDTLASLIGLVNWMIDHKNFSMEILETILTRAVTEPRIIVAALDKLRSIDTPPRDLCKFMKSVASRDKDVEAPSSPLRATSVFRQGSKRILERFSHPHAPSIGEGVQ